MFGVDTAGQVSSSGYIAQVCILGCPSLHILPELSLKFVLGLKGRLLLVPVDQVVIGWPQLADFEREKLRNRLPGKCVYTDLA